MHTLICTLFVHDDGSRHSQVLRGALRNKLFCPPHGRGPPPPPLPPLEPTMARVPRDWQDIVLDDTGRYVVLASRGRGSNALGAAVYPTGRPSGAAGRSLSPGLFELEASSGFSSSKRNGSLGKSGRGGGRGGLESKSMNDLDLSGQSEVKADRPVFQIPGAQRMKPVNFRPSSAEFSLSGFRTSPLIGSYLSGHFEESRSRAAKVSSLDDRRKSSGKGLPVFERSEGPGESAGDEPSSPTAGTASAADLTVEAQSKAKESTARKSSKCTAAPKADDPRAEEKARHKRLQAAADQRQKLASETAYNLAAALGMDSDVTSSIGQGLIQERAYKKVLQKTLGAVNETKRECSKQRQEVRSRWSASRTVAIPIAAC